MKKPLLVSSLLLFITNLLFAQAPGNNNCNSSPNITVGSNCGSGTTGQLYKATAAGPTSVQGTAYDVWYKFTVPPGAPTIRIVVTLPGTSTSLSLTNTFIEVFNSTTCPSGAPFLSSNISNPILLTGLTANTQYFFRIFTTTNPTGGGGNTPWTFNICLSAPPATDECIGAAVIPTGVTTSAYNLYNATGSSAVPVACATGNPDDDMWYKFVAAADHSTIYLSSLGANIATDGVIIQAFSGTCGSLTSIGCGKNEVNLSGLTKGDVYYFRVYAPATGAVGGNTSGSAFKITITPSAPANVGSGRMKEVFQQTILSGPDILYDPWDVTYGPDGYLWITESKGYKIYRMDPATGARDTVLNISYNSTFFSSASDKAYNVQFDFPSQGPQGGLAGIAIHPKLLDATSPENYVYVSYIRSSNGAPYSPGKAYTNSVVRFTFNPGTKRLESPETICDTLPGSNDHNSQRMIIAPVALNGTNYLFYAGGDMGAGQLDNKTRPNKAQNKNSYEGKILRFNLNPSGTGTGKSPWIPEDNPYNNLPTKSAVWVTGIRNNQGFAYDAAKNILYGSSHGPYSDDEINIIEKKRNYGHPYVIGYASDANYDGSGAGAYLNSTCPTIVSEQHNADSIDLADPSAKYKDPLFSAYTKTKSYIHNVWMTNPGNGGWPSEGWSGMDIYNHNLIPGWKNSLLLGSLKWGRVLRVKLDDLGTSIVQTAGEDTISYFGSVNRYRDLAFSPDGKDMYVIMDKSATTSGPSAVNPIVPACPGCLQKYTFLGYASDGSNRSTIPTAITVTAAVGGTCTAGTEITISGANNNLWVPITGPDGNILAEIKANGQNLGKITSSVYKNNSGSLRIAASKRYLDRNITITPETQPSSPVDIRLYLTKTEFNALAADPLSVVDDITDLRIMKNNDICRSSLVSATTFVTVDYAAAHGTTGYVLQGKVSSFSSFYFSSSPVTLPVDLLSFTGTLVNNNTLLQWQTTNEKNALNFIVERSIDSRNFEAIGSVAAHGTTTEKIDYSFTDENAANQSSATLYYRLRMVDIDGKFKYSNTVTVSLSDIAGKLTLAPNPASHEVKATITSITEGKAKWQLVDNSGRVVLSGTVSLKTGKNVLPININSLKGGVYYLILSGAGIDQRVKLQKI